MASIKRWVVLLDSTAAATGSWIPLDVRYDKETKRAIQGAVTSGDTITIQGITKDVVGMDKSFLTTLETADITTLGTYTADFNDILNGGWTYIRAVKTGTNGRAKIQGFV